MNGRVGESSSAGVPLCFALLLLLILFGHAAAMVFLLYTTREPILCLPLFPSLFVFARLFRWWMIDKAKPDVRKLLCPEREPLTSLASQMIKSMRPRDRLGERNADDAVVQGEATGSPPENGRPGRGARSTRRIQMKMTETAQPGRDRAPADTKETLKRPR